MDKERIERAVREILLAIGEDPDRAGLVETRSVLPICMKKFLRGFTTTPDGI